jgi:nucleoside diphosphate kinase
VEGVPINPLHGSKNEDEAKHDLRFFFPVEQTLVAVKPDGYQTKG